MTDAILARFCSKIQRTESGCWEWKAGRLLPPNLPYGRFKYRGKTHRAHRFIREFIVGEIPNGLWVLHRCANPSCVSPFHTYIGTPKQNTQDALAKGTWVRHRGTQPWTLKGEEVHLAKLTDDQVKEVRARYIPGKFGFHKLARIYGISKQAMMAVIKRRTWRHIP